MTAATEDHPAEAALPAMSALDAGPVRRLALFAAAGGFGAWGVLAAIHLSTVHGTGLRDLFLTYLCGWVYWACLPFGALGLLMIAYLTTASWGVVLRRVLQASTRTLPAIALLFVPVAVGLYVDGGRSSPYWWADASWHGDVRQVAEAKGLRKEAVEEAQHKIHDFLSPWFFLVRAAIYFGVLGGLAYLLNKWARPAEEADDARAKWNLSAVSGPGLIAWVILLTIAVTDWVMSVEPTWASSMFPVVFGMNLFMATMALAILTFYTLNAGRADVLGVVKDKFRIDMGSLLLAFTMIWAYATFSQYMLIWAGNLPEELTFFRKRGDHGWQWVAYFLMGFHWLVPFVVLLFREVKTDPRRMRAVCVMLLVVSAADVIWWLLPAVPHPEGKLHVPMAVAAIVGVGGAWGLLFARELGRRPALPGNSETRFLAAWGHH